MAVLSIVACSSAAVAFGVANCFALASASTSLVASTDSAVSTIAAWNVATNSGSASPSIPPFDLLSSSYAENGSALAPLLGAVVVSVLARSEER